ncbi:hypothetical protein [Rufibacter sp. DG15C]|uniref:hypothetical protein n=1 Tax=Rufibacter sp. DG15C TaxID=1379909 RepID=UPI000ADCF5D5|nr:hypothetical protein [Rufibacter sp. DG15C]
MKPNSISSVSLKGILLLAGSALLFTACQDEQVSPVCYEAIVKDQGCGTTLAILSKDAAPIFDTEAKGDTVFVSTFHLPVKYQVRDKRLYVTVTPASKEEDQICHGIYVLYPKAKIINVQETPCS